MANGRVPIVRGMDTLKPPLPSAPRSPSLPSLPWPAALARLVPRLQRLGQTDEDRFLADASDLADLELRQRRLERDGLPRGAWPPR